MEEKTRQPEVAVISRSKLLEILLDVRPPIIFLAEVVPTLPPEIEREADAPKRGECSGKAEARLPRAEVAEDDYINPGSEGPQAVDPGPG